jgi:hypothetical protein
MLTVKASMFHLQRIIESDTCCGKNAEAAKKLSIFSIRGHFSMLCRAFHSCMCSTPSRYNQGFVCIVCVVGASSAS